MTIPSTGSGRAQGGCPRPEAGHERSALADAERQRPMVRPEPIEMIGPGSDRVAAWSISSEHEYLGRSHTNERKLTSPMGTEPWAVIRPGLSLAPDPVTVSVQAVVIGANHPDNPIQVLRPIARPACAVVVIHSRVEVLPIVVWVAV